MPLKKLKEMNNKMNPFKKVGDAIQKATDKTKQAAAKKKGK